MFEVERINLFENSHFACAHLIYPFIERTPADDVFK